MARPAGSPAPLKSVRLADQVADALLERIRGEAFEPGHRLPTEKEIGEHYGVSRTVVREATRLLLAHGVVEVGAGRGLVVAQVDPAAASQSLSLFLEGRTGTDYADVHEIREILEVEAARRAAERATETAIAELRASHQSMVDLSETADVAALSVADVEFHRSLARATGNDIFLVLLDALAPALLTPRRINLARGEGRVEAVAAHGEILARVAGRDPDGATDAMRRHLAFVIDRWREAAGSPEAAGSGRQ